MVLQSINVDQVAEGENVLPYNARTLASDEFRDHFNTVYRSRRARNGDLNPDKYAIEHEKRRRMINSGLYKVPIPNFREGGRKDALFPSGVDLSGDFLPFPLYLDRMEYMEVPKESIEAIDHDLAKVHVSDIRDTLKDDSLGQSMYQIIKKYHVKEVSRPLIRIVVEDISVAPTHMLVLHGSEYLFPKPEKGISNFPVHSLVLAAHCAKLPPLPPQINSPEGSSGTRELTLPVIDFLLALGPETVPLLLEFIYLQRTDILFSRLLRLPVTQMVARQPDEQERLARVLRITLTTEDLITNLVFLKYFAHNASCLGVFDEGLWTVLDIVYRVVVMALAICHGTPDTLESAKAAAIAFERELESMEDSEVGSGPALDSVNTSSKVGGQGKGTLHQTSLTSTQK